MLELCILVLVSPVRADTWDDFSNNLASDLAPLITLFGEAVTKQWLSESTTTLDLIIFALLPLGILTAVVSAIRVCGSRSLKAFIGRAQEPDAVAEMELCSSTGLSVCEFWSKGGISRVFGRPKILEFAHDLRNTTLDDFYDHKKPPHCGIERSKDYLQKSSVWKEVIVPYLEEGEQDFSENPNLSLNIGIVKTSSKWLWFCVAFGASLQASVFAFASWVVFVAKLEKSGNSPQLWSFCLFVVGTISLGGGMFLCAYLINRTTRERKFERKTKASTNDPPEMYWLQPGGQFVGDQALDAFAYSASLKEYITSWRVKSPDSVTLWLAILLSIMGFIAQFVGLRNVHSSIAMFLLVSTLIMATLRASLRSNRFKEGSNLLLGNKGVEGHELDWLALELGQSIPSPHSPDISLSHTNVWDLPGDRLLNPMTDFLTLGKVIHNAGNPTLITDSKEVECTLKGANEKWKIVQDQSGYKFKIYQDDLYYMAFALSASGYHVNRTETIQRRGVDMAKHRERGKLDQSRPNLGASTMHFRARLGDLTNNSGQIATRWDFNIRDVAINLQTAIESMTDYLLSHSTWISPDNCAVFGWSAPCWAGKTGEELGQYPIHFLLHIQQGRWRTSAEKLEAVLGLWFWSLKSQRPSLWMNGVPEFRYLFKALSERHLNTVMSTLQMWAPTQLTIQRYFPNSYVRESQDQNTGKAVWFLFSDAPSEPFPPTCFHGEYTTDTWHWCLTSLYQTHSASVKLAQSIFTMFISAISRFVLPLSPEEAVKELLKQSPSRKIEKLLEIFISAGLGQRDDAIATMIPPLLASSWLPSTNVIIGWAIDHNRLDAVTFLLESGAVNFELKDEIGRTILEHAKMVEQVEIGWQIEEYIERKKVEQTKAEEEAKAYNEYIEGFGEWLNSGW